MLPPAAKLFFVDVGPGPARQPRHPGRPAFANARCWPATPFRWKSPSAISARDPFAGRVTVTLDKQFSFDQEVSLAPWSEEKVTVPVSVGGPGVHLCEVRLPPDALEYDNHFFLTIAVQEKEEVLIVTDAADDRRNSGAIFSKPRSTRLKTRPARCCRASFPPAELSASAAGRRAEDVFHAGRPVEPGSLRRGGKISLSRRRAGLFSRRPGRRGKSRRAGENHRPELDAPAPVPPRTSRPTSRPARSKSCAAISNRPT